MNFNKKYIPVIITIILMIVIGMFVFNNKNEKEKDNKNKIVTTFYPIYVMTLNVTKGAEDIEVLNLTEKNVGCVHNYTLSTLDMKTIDKANILIENGLNLENFIDKIINANSNIKIINTSKNIKNIIKNEENINPHIWTSISNYIVQLRTICDMLKEYDQKNAEIYEKNTVAYIEKLEKLKNKYAKELVELKGKKSICLNEALEYLAKEIGIETISIPTNHEESNLSAERMKEVIEKMKNEKIDTILVGTEENSKTAKTLEEETDAKIIKLNTGLNGKNNINSYISCMEENLKLLSNN